MSVTRYMVDSVANRSGNTRIKANQQSRDNFYREFDAQYSAVLCQSHLKVLLARKTQFVGTKTLNSALHFVATALGKAKMRRLCQEHISTILFELTLPLLLITQNEFSLWSENAVELRHNPYSRENIVRRLSRNSFSGDEALVGARYVRLTI